MLLPFDVEVFSENITCFVFNDITHKKRNATIVKLGKTNQGAPQS